jgi:SET domain-containing protein
MYVRFRVSEQGEFLLQVNNIYVLLRLGMQVLQQGRKYEISIKKTKSKGWGRYMKVPAIWAPLMQLRLGVFARENIPPGRFIGVYTGELLTEGIVGKRSP